jgi:hypothetical protein
VCLETPVEGLGRGEFEDPADGGVEDLVVAEVYPLRVVGKAGQVTSFRFIGSSSEKATRKAEQITMLPGPWATSTKERLGISAPNAHREERQLTTSCILEVSMEVNMHNGISVKQMSQLLRVHDHDAGHHVLWVDRYGDVRISRVPADLTPVGWLRAEGEDNVLLRFETFARGNNLVGPAAAANLEWVQRLVTALNNEWESDMRGSKYVDIF